MNNLQKSLRNVLKATKSLGGLSIKALRECCKMFLKQYLAN